MWLTEDCYEIDSGDGMRKLDYAVVLNKLNDEFFPESDSIFNFDFQQALLGDMHSDLSLDSNGIYNSPEELAKALNVTEMDEVRLSRKLNDRNSSALNGIYRGVCRVSSNEVLLRDEALKQKFIDYYNALQAIVIEDIWREKNNNYDFSSQRQLPSATFIAPNSNVPADNRLQADQANKVKELIDAFNGKQDNNYSAKLLQKNDGQSRTFYQIDLYKASEPEGRSAEAQAQSESIGSIYLNLAENKPKSVEIVAKTTEAMVDNTALALDLLRMESNAAVNIKYNVANFDTLSEDQKQEEIELIARLFEQSLNQGLFPIYQPGKDLENDQEITQEKIVSALSDEAKALYQNHHQYRNFHPSSGNGQQPDVDEKDDDTPSNSPGLGG